MFAKIITQWLRSRRSQYFTLYSVVKWGDRRTAALCSKNFSLP